MSALERNREETQIPFRLGSRRDGIAFALVIANRPFLFGFCDLGFPNASARKPIGPRRAAGIVSPYTLVVLIFFVENVPEIAQAIVMPNAVDVIYAHGVSAVNHLPDYAMNHEDVAEDIHRPVSFAGLPGDRLSRIGGAPSFPILIAAASASSEEHPFGPRSPRQDPRTGVEGKQFQQEPL